MKIAIGLVFMINLAINLPLLAEDGAWYPSAHGSGDTLGAANFLSPENVRKASELIKTGKVYSLAIPTGKNYPSYAHRTFGLHVVREGIKPIGENNIIGNDDYLATWVGIGTHIDGLGHIGIGSKYYNGIDDQDLYSVTGLKKLSVSEVPPLVGRAVLLDVAGYYGVDVVPGDTAINEKEIRAMLERQKVTLRQGDIVLLYTGWMANLNSGAYFQKMPGIGMSGARFLAKQGIVAVGSDTAGVEVVPAEQPGHIFPVHQELLTRNGVYLIENLNTKALAEDRVYEAFFVASIPVIEGAVQAILHPIAIH